MRKLIYKVKGFPIASETFIVSHIAHAVKQGYAVHIIPDLVYPIATSSQSDLINEAKLIEKIDQYSAPVTKPKRIKAALLILCNPLMIWCFFKLCSLHKKITLEYLFYLKFYKKYSREAVFHVHFANAIPPLISLKKIGFITSKIIVTFHGYDTHTLPKGDALTHLVEDYKNCVNAITVNSHFLKNHLIAKGFDPDTIAVIPIGINVSYFLPEKRTETLTGSFKMISVGRLIPLKGHIYGIRVVKQLVDKGYDVHYTIVGYGSLMETLKENIIDMELQDHIAVVGLKTQEEIKIILRESDIFLMTSTYNEKGRREALGIVAFEAQASGVPVIGFDSGGFPETIDNGNTGFLVPDRDIEAMAKAVEKLILDRKLLLSMQQNAITYAKTNFDITKIAWDYFALYD